QTRHDRSAPRARRHALHLLVGTLACMMISAPAATIAQPPPRPLLKVAYDPTRELYQEINKAFAAQWKQRSGQSIAIQQSHGGSGKQARAGIDGRGGDAGRV